MEMDRKMAEARKRLDWEAQINMSVDPENARKVHAKHATASEACSMCGPYCAMELMSKYLGLTAPKEPC